jgi:hypothetical protein
VSGGHGRSRLLIVVAVIVVAVLVAVLGLTADEGDPNPKPTLALIFGVIAVFAVGLIALQRADLEHAANRDAAALNRAAASGGPAVVDPTALSEQTLWAAMAISPIDGDALRARTEGWDAGRRSLRLGAVVIALILVTVPAIYLLESFVPLLVGGPLIILVAIFGALRAVGPEGVAADERLDRSMAPLGLRLREPGLLTGERHGRAVSVRLGSGAGDASEVTVTGPCREFAAGSKLVEVRSDADGVVVSRPRAGRRSWLCDLWVAEQLASS